MTDPSPVPIDMHRSQTTADRRSELLSLLIDSVKDYAIFVLDPSGYVVTWNPGAEALKGYKSSEIIGKHFSTFYLPEAVESGWPERELALAAKEGRFSDEGWRLRKDGSSFWASVVITALRDVDGNLAGFAKVTQDMTSRREAEERVHVLNKELRVRVSELDESRRLNELRALELQRLSSKLLTIQDEERRRIARDLHDDLGQQLHALKMILGKKDMEVEAKEWIESSIATVRNLSYLLHPPLLDETGLRAALHWFVDGLVKRSGIKISLNIRPPDFPRLPNDVETAIFRVVQESLTNVFRHSGSGSARVDIEKLPDSVTVRVRDFGKGIQSDGSGKILQSSSGVGLSGMRERVRQFKGELIVLRAEPGTMVEAKIPLFTLPSPD